MRAVLIRSFAGPNGEIRVYELRDNDRVVDYRGNTRIGIYEDTNQRSVLMLPVVNQSDVPLRNRAIHRYWTDDHLVLRDAPDRHHAMLEMCSIDAPEFVAV